MTGRGLAEGPQQLLRRFAPTLDRLEFMSRTPGWVPGAGRRPGTATGYSVDFADYRKYDYGDDIRCIDWSIYARLRKLFLRQFRAESELSVHILLDTSNSMSFGGTPKLELARDLAGAFSYVALKRQDRVGLATFSDKLHQVLPPHRSRHQLFRILSTLEKTRPEGRSDFENAFRAYVARASCRGLLVLLSDCYSAGGYRDALRCLSFAGFEVVVVRVLAEEELHPVFEDGVELRDLEDDDRRGPVVGGTRIGNYLRSMEEYSRELAAFCLGQGFPCVETSTSVNFEELTLRLLRAGVWCSS